MAIPAISSGIFGFPKKLCAKLMFDTFEKFAEQHSSFFDKCENLKQVKVIIIDDETFNVFRDEF